MVDRGARDPLGEQLRTMLRCPFCPPSLDSIFGAEMRALVGDDKGGALTGDQAKRPLRVVAYRQRSIRLECRECGIRFSIDVENFADVVVRPHAPTDAAIHEQAVKLTGGDPARYLSALMRARDAADRWNAGARASVVEPHRSAVAAAKPRKGRVRFPKR